ncbi:hypothetical protein Mal64_08210 [Pseudobythopirellula maris]|uniref:DUF2608 domain-containing protein n=1 Tax=Pseudobythopirellula maris TaxID=2527991 RepID=A0A5C5ZSA9_9BACT|nr:DUF2608 domain-containing protein [Pseudobythopirellula maris]TWT90432.1 hypothetical protein Mal64_08210 [Pseudobythopirellula maris]
MTPAPRPEAWTETTPVQVRRTLRGVVLVFALAWSLLATPVGASDCFETKDFAAPIEQVELYIAEHGADNVLLVVDIDNTMLSMAQDLGSDQWFEWQSYLLKHEPDSPELAATDFDGLLEAQGLLFTLGKMRPPQSTQPALIKRVQEQGVRTLVLTSRGDDFRAATIRELVANGYDFPETAVTPATPKAGPYAPYDPKAPMAAGLTQEEFEGFGLGQPRPVSYADGVLMTAGQHKGAMLLTMLHQLEKQPEAIVFVDDHGRHVLRVYDALVRRGVEVSTFHYQHEDDRVARFRYSDKRDVVNRWRRLHDVLAEVFEAPEASNPTLGPAAASSSAGAATAR